MSVKKERLRIALPKGRMSDETMEFLSSRFVTSLKEFPSNRKLIFEDCENNLEFLLVRSKDVGTYVEQGSCDLGVIGFDLLSENKFDVFIPSELPFGHCSLCVAYSQSSDDWQKKKNIRVATKYPYLTSRYFFKLGFNVQIIELYGSIEIAPLTGLSDVIVDLVSSGQTLKENNLFKGPEILKSSARLIMNHSSYFFKRRRIQELLSKITDT
jgi:ATP phosphoribosyltransferase